MEYLQYLNDFVSWKYAHPVLNLVISGIPSILKANYKTGKNYNNSFKPCYKWNTFNTEACNQKTFPSLLVLNLVISGIPSILLHDYYIELYIISFKPCYKWNTFNTVEDPEGKNKLPSFKPCYKWNTFNTLRT